MPSGNQLDSFEHVGVVLQSETEPGVTYHLERGVGKGGMGKAYLAERRSQEGSAPVVVKIMNPNFAGGEVAPQVVATKEAVALQRLNELLPPSPFVVRFVAAGSAALGTSQSIPWTAIEYVHGGVEGTTLEDRVTYSVHKTGYAFDRARTAHAVRCLTAGLTAIHAVGVIHRDLTPGNVLCCGFGAREVFKIADFGVARASGVQLTFEGLCLGTVGYSPPEAASASAGPATDVFAFAAVVYYLLTGQRYFPADSPVEALHLIIDPSRPHLMDHPTLAPELAEHPSVCQAIDDSLREATALDPRARFETPNQFATELLASLGEHHSGPRSSRRLFSAVQSARETYAQSYRFSVVSHPHTDFLISSAAFDATGHALALLANGGRFWNGDTWLDARPVLSKIGETQRFVQTLETGGWVIGGEAVWLVDFGGNATCMREAGSGFTYLAANGRIDDVMLVVGHDQQGELLLWPVVARRWLKPLSLKLKGRVHSLARLDDTRFMLVCSSDSGTARVAVATPLDWEVEWLDVAHSELLLAAAALPERRTALAVGSGGLVLSLGPDGLGHSTVPKAPKLTAVAVDLLGREWVAGESALYTRDPKEEEAFHLAWQDARFEAPWVALLAEPGRILAMSADGAIVEGRAHG